MIFGLLLGTLCLFLLVGIARRHRYHHAHAGGPGRSCGPRGHHRGPHGHRRGHHNKDDGSNDGSSRRPRPRDRASWLRRQAARRLNLDDHQQDVVEVAIRQADKAAHTFTDILLDSRDELADAVKGEQIDQARLDAVFEKWDESQAEARQDMIDALRRAHAALEPEQRRRLAEWIGLVGGRSE